MAGVSDTGTKQRRKRNMASVPKSAPRNNLEEAHPFGYIRIAYFSYLLNRAAARPCSDLDGVRPQEITTATGIER